MLVVAAGLWIGRSLRSGDHDAATSEVAQAPPDTRQRSPEELWNERSPYTRTLEEAPASVQANLGFAVVYLEFTGFAPSDERAVRVRMPEGVSVAIPVTFHSAQLTTYLPRAGTVRLESIHESGENGDDGLPRGLTAIGDFSIASFPADYQKGEALLLTLTPAVLDRLQATPGTLDGLGVLKVLSRSEVAEELNRRVVRL